MISLLDVNVLVALVWPNHIQHDAATDWFGALSGQGWATCPVTQSGFVRVSSNRKVIPTACSPGEACEVLSQMVRLPGHVFWEDDISIAGSNWVARRKLLGHRQITDAHLLALALRHGGRLASFDRGIVELLPNGVGADEALVVLKANAP